MYATKPPDLQPQSFLLLFKGQPDSETASSTTINTEGKKIPTTCKQRGCEILLLQTRLRLQQRNACPVTAKLAPAKKLLGCVFLSIPPEHRYLTKSPRRWKNIHLACRSEELCIPFILCIL